MKTPDRELTMAELAAQAKLEPDADQAGAGAEAPARESDPHARDDELLDDPPHTDHHLGRFAGWRAARQVRVFVGAALGLAVIVAGAVFLVHNQALREQEEQLRQKRLHPLPELEATITPGTPREMTVSEGNMRVSLSAEAPAINLLHLPDRDITLAPGVDKAQLKVEVNGGKTTRLVVLTGEIVETLTHADAQPLLP
ncbi:hypothetical protein DB30_03431 [Enhygromyxa salina]|uniref:Uncharacterized protein n=1 Tax=Enhygromyxa salina TaxID=215803 RepID=A0A0C1ZIL0_9BACT|nr:hypothetical protein [Enhygromyxa salina]KIG17374.1 hypothetical protein DB30_03431 [Enhygromyxa salina]